MNINFSIFSAPLSITPNINVTKLRDTKKVYKNANRSLELYFILARKSPLRVFVFSESFGWLHDVSYISQNNILLNIVNFRRMF